MKIQLTAREIQDRDLWDEFCELRGINPWAMSEGQMDNDETFTFTEQEAQKLGLIPKSH